LFFFSSRRRHTRFSRDWSSDVCSSDLFQKLYKVYWDTDASLAEINPLILEGNGGIKALDAKFNFDSNALFRHPEIVEYRDLDEELGRASCRERAASPEAQEVLIDTRRH